MKEIIINDANLKLEDMQAFVVRVKALLFNSKGKIILAHNNGTYQFPGGHKENNESINDCIVREIKEETGIDVNITEEPFLKITTYDNNYFNTGKRVCNTIFYYRIFTDEMPDFSKTHYDELETATDFNLFYVYFADLGNFLRENIKLGNVDNKIGREMIYVLDEYQKIFGSN